MSLRIIYNRLMDYRWSADHKLGNTGLDGRKTGTDRENYDLYEYYGQWLMILCDYKSNT